MELSTKKGLDIPIEGRPTGSIQDIPRFKQLALNLDPFNTIRFKVLVKVGESVKIGQPLVENKSIPGQMFVSPAAGVISEIRRGLKRRLLDIIIDVDEQEESVQHTTTSHMSRKDICDLFMVGGIFPHIRMRPFDLIANPEMLPRAIFVQAVETLPFTPSAHMQVEGHDPAFKAGLETLKKLTDGDVHLVYREGSAFPPFSEAQGVKKHTVKGPHPVGNPSFHMHKIDPIRGPNDCVWTLKAIDVVVIGKIILEGRYFTKRILAVGGGGIVSKKTGFFRARSGLPISALIADRIDDQAHCLISGNPLTGVEVEATDFMGFYHTAFSVIPKNTTRELFHFLRPGINKYTATGAYLTGHVKPPKEGFTFTTNQHGEERAFIDGAVYDKVMPLSIPTMQLVKAVLAEDFEVAEQLGLLEVVGEDFALASFICPSKIEMIQIINEGLHSYSKEMGY